MNILVVCKQYHTLFPLIDFIKNNGEINFYILSSNEFIKIIEKNLSIYDNVKFISIMPMLFSTEKKFDFKKFISLIYANIAVKFFFSEYKIDLLITTGSAGTYNIFQNIAKRRGIKTILINATALTFKKSHNLTKESFLKKKYRKLMKYIFNFDPSYRYGDKADIVCLNISIWKDYIFNDRIEIIGNKFLKQEVTVIQNVNKLEALQKLQNEFYFRNDKIITFFSQKFFEMKKIKKEDALKMYELVNKIADKYKNYIVILKPHPDEKLFNEVKFKENVIIISERNYNEILIAISEKIILFPTTSVISANCAKKKFIVYIPDYLPKEFRIDWLDVMKPFISNIAYSENSLFSKLKKNLSNDMSSLCKEININSDEKLLKIIKGL